jgi:5-(carboxyamino)imidazole ribonucleotide synthase
LIKGQYDDADALERLSAHADVVTYEFENVPAETARFVSVHRPLRPDARALAVAQDRLAEKAFLSGEGIPVTPYCPVTCIEDLEDGVAALGLPAVLKTTREGYDGKGQVIVRDANVLADLYAALSPRPLVLEAFVPFEREISVIVARGLGRTIAAYDPAENRHAHHILATSTVPAGISVETAAEARRIAGRIVEGLDYIGVMGVEFFVLPGGGLLVNEIAPRVHNSGHWTEAVCATDQFEQHIRAICGWPLGDPRRFADAEMENLIGDDVHRIPTGLPGDVRLHLYGKAEVRPGRKMGHLTRIRRP